MYVCTLYVCIIASGRSLCLSCLLLGSDETYVISFVVPNQKQLLALAAQHAIRGSWEELCSNVAMEELALKVITEAAVAGDKQGYSFLPKTNKIIKTKI